MRPTAVVVDDSPLIRNRLRQILSLAGAEVVAEGSTGDDAAALYEHHRPTLLFLDIVMPKKDGVTAAIEILRAHPGATIIMCSSLTARDKVLACRQAGVSSFILKPFDEAKTLDLVRAILARPPAAAVATREVA